MLVTVDYSGESGSEGQSAIRGALRNGSVSIASRPSGRRSGTRKMAPLEILSARESLSHVAP